MSIDCVGNRVVLKRLDTESETLAINCVLEVLEPLWFLHMTISQLYVILRHKYGQNDQSVI